MNSDFKNGYDFYIKSSNVVTGTEIADNYINNVNAEIDKLVSDLNRFSKNGADISQLKGNIAEVWQADTFNIKAVLNDSNNRVKVDNSNDYASVDISSNFGEKYGLKYYKNSVESAKQQAKSVLEKFNEYKSAGGTDDLSKYLKDRNIPEDANLYEPIYSGQIRIIPAEQLEGAIKFLKEKIAKESITRPEQVERYQETLKMLTDRIKDNNGNESIPLTTEEAKRLAALAKEGNITTDNTVDITNLMEFEYVMKQSFKAGMTAAMISVALKIAPEVLKTIKHLIDEGEIDKEELKEIGLKAKQGATEGFIKGSVAAAITVSIKSGMLNGVLKDVNPNIVGMLTVIAYDTIVNSIEVSAGRMTKQQLTNELLRLLFSITCGFALGTATQSAFIEIPVAAYIIGNLIGTVTGSIIYNLGYEPIMALCVANGFTMFGLVDQSYTLSKEDLESLGAQVLDYDRVDYDKIDYDIIIPEQITFNTIEPERIEFKFLRRGVIGISQVGFI